MGKPKTDTVELKQKEALEQELQDARSEYQRVQDSLQQKLILRVLACVERLNTVAYDVLDIDEDEGPLFSTVVDGSILRVFFYQGAEFWNSDCPPRGPTITVEESIVEAFLEFTFLVNPIRYRLEAMVEDKEFDGN